MSSVDRHKPIDLGLCGLQKSRLLSFFFVFISDPTFALCLSEKIAPPIDLAAVFLLHKNLGAILCCLICYMICFVNFPSSFNVCPWLSVFCVGTMISNLTWISKNKTHRCSEDYVQLLDVSHISAYFVAHHVNLFALP